MLLGRLTTGQGTGIKGPEVLSQQALAALRTVMPRRHSVTKKRPVFAMEAQFYGEYHGDVLWG